MIRVDAYISELVSMLKAQFGVRLCYVGLQGSYLRGEATDSSDIDIMVVIDGLSVADLDSYRTIIESLTDFPTEIRTFLKGPMWASAPTNYPKEVL